MKRKKMLMGVLAVGLLAGVYFMVGDIGSSVERNQPATVTDKSVTWRHKLRIEVETPNGVVSGESVAEGRISELDFSLAGNAVKGNLVSGEATVVDLGNGKYLFALLDGIGDESWYLPFYTFVDEFPAGYCNCPDGLTYVDAAKRFTQTNAARPVPLEKFPKFMIFTDKTRPSTAVEVAPENFSSVLGTGYKLSSVTLEIVKEKVTNGEVKKILPWIESTDVMENPGWSLLPVNARELISGLVE